MRHVLAFVFATALTSPALAGDSPDRFLVRYEVAGRIIGLQAEVMAVEMPVAKQALSSGNAAVRANTAKCIIDYQSEVATAMHFFEGAKKMNSPDQREWATLFIEAAAHHWTQGVQKFTACLIRNQSLK